MQLLLQFEHQGYAFVCSAEWQDYQRVRYPRASHLPKPEGSVLAACSPKTRQLFADALPNRSGDGSEEVREDYGNVSVPPARGRARNANANTLADLDLQGERERAAAFEAFWLAYPRRDAKKAAEKAFAKVNPGPDLLSTLLEAIARQKRTDGWRDPRFIPLGSTWLNGERWKDEAAAVVPAAVQRATTPPRASWRDRCWHVPACGTPEACALLQAKAEHPDEVPA